MTDFHKELREKLAQKQRPGDASKSQALRQAMLRALARPDTRHPFYWAGFVLLGDGF